MRKLLDWIKGFQTVNYSVELEEKGYVYDKEPEMLDFESKRRSVMLGIKVNKGNTEYIKNPKFNINDFEIKMIKDNKACRTYRNYWKKNKDSGAIYCITTYDTKYKSIKLRDNSIILTGVFLGIDDRIWKITIDANCRYICRNGLYKNEVSEQLLLFIESYVRFRMIDKMSAVKFNLFDICISDFKEKTEEEISKCVYYNSDIMLSHDLK